MTTIIVMCLAAIACLTTPTSGGTIRRYYVMATEVTWDYTGGDVTNMLRPGDTETPKNFLETRQDRIGAVYHKAMYVECTDDTFSTRAPRPRAWGLTGPLLRAEVGDTLEIIYFNNASREYSMHPHGVKYLKEHESAIYVDGTSGRQKDDDIVFPGEKIRMLWNVTDRDAPGPDDANCVPWVYHSHINTEGDTSAGMMGVLVTCRPGTLDANNQRTDVVKDYPLLVKIWDENLSWYLRDNAHRCLDPSQCTTLIDEEDEDFIESNYMAAINGYMYGHLPDLTACVGEKVAFYVIGMGNEFDIHSLHFHGQNMKYQHTRGDTISVYSATFVAGEMTPPEPGRWLIGDMVGDNLRNGMGAFLFTRDCPVDQVTPKGPIADDLTQQAKAGPIREYFLQAEAVMWDYNSNGVDARTGEALTDDGAASQPYFTKSSTRIGGVYKKARYMAYNDSSFTTVIARPSSDTYMGTLGPVLRAEAGDTLKVTLKNSLTSPVSLLPHVLTYSSDEEMRGDPSTSSGGHVLPGDFHTYVFTVPGDLLDNATEPCLNFIYSSGFDPQTDQNSGLAGPLLLCRKDYSAKAGPKPTERFLLFQTVDENKSMFLKENLATNNVSVADLGEPAFMESNLMYSINGFSFGALPVYTSCVGDDVTWYVMALGRTEDVNTVTFDGHTFSSQGRHRDTRALVPGSTAALHMVMDNPGRWMIESHTNLAYLGGMFGFYNVSTCGQSVTSSVVNGGVARQLYVQAEEVMWDYAPRETSIIDGMDLNDPRGASNIFFKDDGAFIGDVYKKAVYREYTDATFTARKNISDGDLHKDILGPIIRAEVGDVIHVTFRNMASRNYSMHPQGLKYSEASSGVSYAPGQAVSPGQTVTYVWSVPERAGPGSHDPACLPWLYYSALDPVKDVYSGLVGVVTVCRKGTIDASGRRSDVDAEFVLLMSVFNENHSWYLDDNIALHAPERMGTDYGSDGDFEESNIMHAINGRLHGNTHHLVMDVNDTVAWHFAAIGTEVDLHSFHLHGHTVLQTSDGHRNDAVNLFPGEAEAVEMFADNPGTWLLHCHQLDHIIAGMETVYTVRGTLGAEGWTG